MWGPISLRRGPQRCFGEVDELDARPTDAPPDNPASGRSRRWRRWRFFGGATIVFGMYGPLGLARSGPALAPATAATSRPTTSLTVEQTARASVVATGQIRSGGLWAIKGSALLVSTDYGQTWRAHSIPERSEHARRPALFMLDADHAWSITGRPHDLPHERRRSKLGRRDSARQLRHPIRDEFRGRAGRVCDCLDDYARATVMRSGNGG